MILYEYPFNERIRTYLRLEHLFRRILALINREDPLDHHFLLVTLFELIEVAARSDLKSEVLKDLEKNKQTLIGYRGNPAISEMALEQAINQLDECFNLLNHQSGKTGSSLTDNEWLNSLRSRFAIPGGTCEFDLPSYFAWQHRPAAFRREQLIGWVQSVEPMMQAVMLLLSMLRDSGTPQKVMAVNGHFQQNLPQGRTYQLMRLKLDSQTGLVPEISGNRLLVSVRLMNPTAEGLHHACSDDTPLIMTLCA